MGEMENDAIIISDIDLLARAIRRCVFDDHTRHICDNVGVTNLVFYDSVKGVLLNLSHSVLIWGEKFLIQMPERDAIHSCVW